MTSDDAARPKKRTYESIPPEVQRELLIAIRAHRHEHGSRRYDIVRDHPEFARWVGTATGETGRRRFTRLVKKVSRSLPKGRKGPEQEIKAASGAQSTGGPGHGNDRSGAQVVLTPDQVLAGGDMAAAGWSELMEVLRDGPADIELVRQSALADDPAGGEKIVNDPELLLRVNKERRAWAECVYRLMACYTSLFRQREFAERVIQVLQRHLADDPSKLAVILAALNDIIGDMGGMPATSARLT